MGERAGDETKYHYGTGHARGIDWFVCGLVLTVRDVNPGPGSMRRTARWLMVPSELS